MTRVLVTGGRDFADRALVFESLDTVAGIAAAHPCGSMRIVVVHGARQTGVDRFAAEWAAERGFPDEPWPADWCRFGKAAGPIRNQAMVDSKPVMVLAFERGAGTADCVRCAEAAAINTYCIIRYDMRGDPLNVAAMQKEDLFGHINEIADRICSDAAEKIK